jgi:hypothetical protein
MISESGTFLVNFCFTGYKSLSLITISKSLTFPRNFCFYRCHHYHQSGSENRKYLLEIFIFLDVVIIINHDSRINNISCKFLFLWMQIIIINPNSRISNFSWKFLFLWMSSLSLITI